MTGAVIDYARLRRWPDVEAENLFAYDAGDPLLLETAAAAGLPAGRQIVVVNDHYGALTLGLAAHGATGLRVHQDALSGERAIDANAERLGPELGLDLSGAYRHLPLGRELFEGATLVLLQLPRSLDALDEIAWQAARWADPGVRLLAVGRVKHMSLAMNEVLGRSFASVTAGLARQKSRVLDASLPRGGDPSGSELPPARFPLGARHGVVPGTTLELRAFGATFGGAKLDPGTRFLLEHLDGLRAAGEAVDLGCGNGTIAAFLAVSRPGLSVLACDQSASAVASTAATAAANGVADRVTAVRDDALSALAGGSKDLVLLNPPFHMGNTVHAGIALKLFADAGRVLAPGGELWCVWNSHLRYRPQLERLVGPTRQVARNAKFTVTVSTKR